MNNGIPLQEWTTDDVGRWLADHQLRHLISRFESLGITGEHLITMDDSMMRNDLRINNPGERAAINGALMNIRADSHRTFTMPERPRSSSFEQKKFSPNTRLNTMPPQRHRTVPSVPSRRSAEMLIAPAPQLLDDACRHSGWIRKMGGSYKSWKQRYLILRLGHLYYYENESAKAPKGHFPLRGYIAEATTEIKKFPWVFKLRHNDSKMRTYYIGVAAKRELEQWVTQLNKEIQETSTGLSKAANTFPHSKNSTVISPQDAAQCESDEDDQVLYDEVPGEEAELSEDDTPYEQMQEEPHYDSVPQEMHSDDEREEEYEQIEENQFVPPRPHPSPIPPHTPISPTHGHSSSSCPPPGSSWPHHYPPRPGQVPVPIIPPRTMESLSTSLSQTTDPEVEPENPYLSILGQSASGSQPTTPASVTSESGYGQHIAHNNHGDQQDEPSLDPTEEENPYYITLGSVCDVMPDYCVFGTISRDDAESRLSKSHRVGTYLLRDGHHQGAVKVLSVWAGQKCRHYKLYKEEKGFCLTHGDGFPTIPMLLQHYKENEMLPKSDYNLGEPYHPLDH